MAFPLVVEPEAEKDITSAYRWYEAKHSGLGREFIECVDDVFQRLCTTPEVHAVMYKSIRQALVRRFPYVVCYVFQDDCVSVIAVFHGHRDPKAWESRI